MNKIKVYFCLLAFALLMGMKCFQPELTENIRTKISEVMEEDVNYEQLLQSLGREYTESGLRKELAEVFQFDRWAESLGIGADGAKNASAEDTGTAAAVEPSDSGLVNGK